jgi:tetratricopeptide (TPR) repeat protein
MVSARDYTGAIAWYTHALTNASADRIPPLYNNIGVCFMSLGNTSAAREAFSRAVAADPGYGRGYINRAAIHEKTGDPDRALEDLREAARADPIVSAEAIVKSGNILASGGKIDQAIEAYMQAEPDATGAVRADLYNGLGAAYLLKHLPNKAEQAFITAIAADPGGAALAHTNLGVIRIAEGNLQEAEKEFQTAITNDQAGTSQARQYLASLEQMMTLKKNQTGSS